MTNRPVGGYYHVVRCTFGDSDQLDAWNHWYETVHIPGLLAVPGFHSVTRFADLASERSYVAIWDIDGPEVFEQPAYQAAKGFGAWEPYVDRWTIELLQRVGPVRAFGTAAPATG